MPAQSNDDLHSVLDVGLPAYVAGDFVDRYGKGGLPLVCAKRRDLLAKFPFGCR